MILWRRTIGIGLGLVAASSLWAAAQAYPSQEEVAETSTLTLVDETQMDDVTDSLTAIESLPEVLPIAADELAAPIAVEALAAEITPVPTEVLENLSQDQMDAIAAIILAADSTSPSPVASLSTEVLTRLDTLPGVEQQVGRRRWLPTGLVRRLRLPQMIASLIRQPKNAALVMLGNHIVVVNPVTGAVLGAVLSAL